MPFDDRGFAADVRKLGDQMAIDVIGDLVRAAGGAALRGVVDKSPVDTGRFKGNWQVVRSPNDASERSGIDPAGQKTIADGLRDLDALVASDPTAPLAIANPLPYAVSLEYGHSKQAPNGMVAVTVAEVQSAFGGSVT